MTQTIIRIGYKLRGGGYMTKHYSRRDDANAELERLFNRYTEATAYRRDNDNVIGWVRRLVTGRWAWSEIDSAMHGVPRHEHEYAD